MSTQCAKKEGEPVAKKISIEVEREHKQLEITYKYQGIIRKFVNRSQSNPIPTGKDANLIKIHRKCIQMLIRKIFSKVNKMHLFIVVPQSHYDEIDGLLNLLSETEETLHQYMQE